ncbi:DUF4309 domain-containing protein [Caenorhabditis elegans]|uniref:DUF4309 domain-containing protein n=1 Tax=Caenorhabditis elegans TaxID=6239 RepID=Q18068_CAEEL|nr:DUF4309 domain-containing protein [Caenorhabditis elegans]CCD65068.1 DUF4309 domain-containing protein [Caenorhabditis elegans]|eukprot:NP_509356.3 Uncharacterized protein CELE_C18A11.3 [Caenorhabditis elegans]
MSKSGSLPRFADEFEDDDDIELVEGADFGKNLRSFGIRLAISLVLIGCVAGAVIWSFVQGETGTGTPDIHHRDASKNFSIFIDQYSQKEGLYITTYRLPEGSSDEEPKQEEYQSFWFQSDTNKTLAHQITPTVTIYAFEHHAYWYDTSANPAKCTFDPKMNYLTYIRNLGMTNLERHHSEYEETHNGEKVFVYQGNPNEVLLTNVNQTAFLITAYADAKTGALLAWDTYFTSETDSSEMVFKASYEYPHMIPAKPDPSYLVTPTECSP